MLCATLNIIEIPLSRFDKRSGDKLKIKPGTYLAQEITTHTLLIREGISRSVLDPKFTKLSFAMQNYLLQCIDSFNYSLKFMFTELFPL